MKILLFFHQVNLKLLLNRAPGGIKVRHGMKKGYPAWERPASRGRIGDPDLRRRDKKTRRRGVLHVVSLGLISGRVSFRGPLAKADPCMQVGIYCT